MRKEPHWPSAARTSPIRIRRAPRALRVKPLDLSLPLFLFLLLFLVLVLVLVFGLSLTPRFSGVTARPFRTFNRFSGFSACHHRAVRPPPEAHSSSFRPRSPPSIHQFS